MDANGFSLPYKNLKGIAMKMNDYFRPSNGPQVKDFLKTVRYHHDNMLNTSNAEVQRPCLFFVTLTFNELPQETKTFKESKDTSTKNFYDPAQVLKITHERQSKFYKHVLNQTVPSNHFPNRKRDFPVSLSFIDLSGSRFGRSSFLKMPHTHSIFIVPPKTVPRFEELRLDNFRLNRAFPKTKDIQTLDCQSVPLVENDLFNVLSYSSKFYRSDYISSLPEETWSICFSMHG